MLIFKYLLQYSPPEYFPSSYKGLPQPPSYRDAVTNAFVYVHQTLHKANARLVKRGSRTMAITPRHYLDFINHYVSIISLKTIFFIIKLNVFSKGLHFC